MAIKKIGITTETGIEKFMCTTTDAKNTWPTDCGAGSKMCVYNDTTDTVDHYERFTGVKWIRC